jgi:hypothetical protein
MRKLASVALALFLMTINSTASLGESAVAVLGKDFTFPNKIDGLLAKLSDFKDLKINFFQTSDGVKLSYWEAGHGKPLIFVPAWSANGAEYINVMYLLRDHYHIYGHCHGDKM